MSARSINTKRANRVRKAMRSSLPTYVDLVHWLQLHGYADTAGGARKIILAGRVRSESHKLGIEKRPVVLPQSFADVYAGKPPEVEEQDVVSPLIPSDLMKSVEVMPA